VYNEYGWDSDSPYYTTTYSQHVVLWEDGIAADLTSLLLDNPGVTLYDATAINATGQIAARTLGSGAGRAVLLTPANGPVVPVPKISVNDVSVVEGNSGAVSAAFTVSLSAAYDQTVTVTFATADGSASAGSDYQPAGGVLTFAPGERTKAIPVL